MARLIFCLAASILLAGTSLGRDEDARAPKGNVLVNNYFGLNLFNKLCEENAAKPTRDNIFFSPYSVSVAMAMLNQGASGNTTKEIESVLGYQLAKLDKNSLATEIKDSNRALFSSEVATNSSNKYVLKSGNAIFSNKQFTMLESYGKALKDNFQAESFQLDFGKDPTAAMSQINQWCSNKTNGKITQILSEPPSPSTQLALLNAVYFKGSWKNKFDKNKTLPDTFTGPNGVKYENVPFMNIKSEFKVAHLEELNAALVELPYEGDDLSMYAILPSNKDDDLKLVRKALNPWYLESAIGRAYQLSIKLKFPKLDFKTDYDLISTLKKLGITEVFDGQKSDLSALAGPNARLTVDQVKHVATIEVNEEGSEAAAATYVGIILTASIQPQEKLFAFDHPFVFAIRHNQNGQILFVGEVNRF